MKGAHEFMTGSYEAVVSFFDNVDVASVLDEKYFVENVS
jgi:hypothetical protein